MKLPHLTPYEEALFIALVSNEVSPIEVLVDAVEGAPSQQARHRVQESPDAEFLRKRNVIMTVMTRLRSKLATIQVEVINRRYKGWSIPEESMARLAEIIDRDGV